MQARGVAEGIIAAVSLMKDSGLPCFGRGRPVENLRKRFHLDLSDAQAATFMRATIADAYDKVCHTLGCNTKVPECIFKQQRISWCVCYCFDCNAGLARGLWGQAKFKPGRC